MLITVGAICFLTGAGVSYLVLWSRLKRLNSAVAAEQVRASDIDGARQRLEVDLAASRPEANRSAQLGIRVGELNDEVTSLSNRCAELAATLKERDSGLDEQKGEVRRLTELAFEANARILALEVEKAELSRSIAEREQALVEERGQFGRLRDDFKAQFAELSASALKNNSESFLATATRVLALQQHESEAGLAKREEEIRQLVKPIQDGIKAVADAAREIEGKREKSFGSIEEQLRQSTLHSAEVARQASALKDALKRPIVRGRWGEVQLMNCVELAGMAEHCDVKFQSSSVSIENDRIRPDMEVYMPGGRKIVVDAKTPMEYFLKYIDAATDEEKVVAIAGHARGVKAHISDLAKIDYMQKVAGSPDFVVMFLPNESFLAMALEKEPNVMEEALAKKVLLATPATLIGLLKVIRYGWTEQRQTESARKILAEGSKLNTQITTFLLDFAKLGAALKSASEFYDSSVRRVEKQIASSSSKLSSWDARSRKKLSKSEARLLSVGEFDEGELEDPEETPASLLEVETKAIQ